MLTVAGKIIRKGDVIDITEVMTVTGKSYLIAGWDNDYGTGNAVSLSDRGTWLVNPIEILISTDSVVAYQACNKLTVNVEPRLITISTLDMYFPITCYLVMEPRKQIIK